MADPLGSIIRAAAKYPGDILARTKVTPNQLTLIGFLANCYVAVLISAGQIGFLAMGLLIWVAGFFDALDGSVARTKGRVTVFGNFFDSTLDRYSDAVIYLGIMAYFLNAGQTDHAMLTAVAMLGSLAVSYVRAKAESLSLQCEVGLMPRAVRILILGAGFCFYRPTWSLLIIAVLSHLTVAQRVLYVRKHLSKKS